MNNLKSYTEYAVTTPTTDFVIGFDFNYGTDAVNVTVDGVPATEAGYSVIYLNSTTMRLSPAVPIGVVRLQRETDIDDPDNQFTAGAKFIASNMDENFKQIRKSQQEVRDGFGKLSEDTYEIIDTLQVVGQAAQDAADAAEQAAQAANDAAAQVNDKVSYQDLDAAVDTAVQNTVAEGLPATAIKDSSGKDQQQINDSTVKELLTNLTIPVGVGQTHTTIKSALGYLTKFKKVFVSTDITANILLKSGFVAQEQISVEGMDLSWITISSEDAEVVVRRSALTEKIGRWWSFMRFRNSSSPKINTLFNMDEAGTELDRVNLYLIHSNSWVEPGKGFKNGYRNVDITQGSNFVGASGVFTGGKNVSIRPATSSQAFLQFADVSNSNTGISCGSGAVVAAEDVIARNCTVTGVEVQGACTVEANGLDVSGAGQFGIYARKACIVNADRLICNGGAGYGVYASNGAVVNIDRAQITNTTGVAGVLATYGATVAGDNVVVTGNKTNIFASKGGSVSLDVSTLTGGVDYGLYSSEGGRIVATNSNYRKTVGVDSTTDARVRFVAEINVFNSTGGGFATFDVQTVDGVIRKNGRSVSQGGATIASGTTSIVVTHGLVGQPAVVATPRSDIDASNIWISAVNASTFTISISEAPAANLNLFWSASLN